MTVRLHAHAVRSLRVVMPRLARVPVSTVVARHYLAGRGAFDEFPNDPARCDLAQLMGMDMDEMSWPRLEQLIQYTLEQRRWLILVGHDVGGGWISDGARGHARPDLCVLSGRHERSVGRHRGGGGGACEGGVVKIVAPSKSPFVITPPRPGDLRSNPGRL